MSKVIRCRTQVWIAILWFAAKRRRALPEALEHGKTPME